jgi:hypothetical protein
MIVKIQRIAYKKIKKNQRIYINIYISDAREQQFFQNSSEKSTTPLHICNLMYHE